MIRRTITQPMRGIKGQRRVVMEILGHSQISMTSKYAHVLPEVMTDAADRIGQALWGYPSGPTATRTATKRPDGSATQ